MKVFSVVILLGQKKGDVTLNNTLLTTCSNEFRLSRFTLTLHSRTSL